MSDAPQPRLLILDADGTLRWTVVPGRTCPRGPGEWRLMPNVRERLRGFDWSSTRLGVASNQTAVALGELSEETARTLLQDLVREAVGHLPPGTMIEICTCAPEVDCPCRKPAPGMLLRIVERQAVPPEESLFVGDLDIDREAARRAGVPFAWAADFFGWNR